jgi:hypothetical protein
MVCSGPPHDRNGTWMPEGGRPSCTLRSRPPAGGGAKSIAWGERAVTDSVKSLKMQSHWQQPRGDTAAPAGAGVGGRRWKAARYLGRAEQWAVQREVQAHVRRLRGRGGGAQRGSGRARGPTVWLVSGTASLHRFGH